MPATGAEVAPLDVMVWIHGGGWFTGSGNSDMYGPQYLLDKDVILVTINYRLGTLGTFTLLNHFTPTSHAVRRHRRCNHYAADCGYENSPSDSLQGQYIFVFSEGPKTVRGPASGVKRVSLPGGKADGPWS